MIKAIPTRYAGYFFRSRLEARWAVFFDAAGLEWTYEPEGFQLPSGTHYLPDFRLQLAWKSGGVEASKHARTLWIEVKPHGERSAPLQELLDAGEDDWRGAVLHDIPDPRRVASYGHYYSDMKRDSDAPYCLSKRGWDNYYVFCVCDGCQAVGFEFDGRSARIGCGCSGPTADKNYTADHPTLVNAFAKARAARFEHGDRERYAA